MTGRIFLLLMLALPALAGAQTSLRDPTLPPPTFLTGQNDVVAGNDQLRLEAIRRPQGAPAVALINGEFWRVGQEIAGRKLVRIGEAEVVLRDATHTEILRMSPGVEKTMKSNRKDRPGADKSARGGV